MDWAHGLPDAALSRTFAFVGADDLEAFCPCTGLVDHWGAAEMTGKDWFNGLPKGVRLSILAFVGAHNLQDIWHCECCKPSWRNWYCHRCNHEVNAEQWTHLWVLHVRLWLLEVNWVLPEDARGCCMYCADLFELSLASLETRRALNTYTGRAVVTQSVGTIYYPRRVLALLKRRWATQRSRALATQRAQSAPER